MMIPLTGRNTQHSSFTWALQPSSSAQASTHAFEGWPGASELAADSLHLPSNLPHPSLNDIPLPQQQHDPTSAGQQANVTDIFASEQTEDLLFTNYLSDLSVFDAIDFDDMLAYAISDNAPPIIQQQQHQHHQQQPQQHHQQQHSDSQAGVNKWIASHPDRTSSPSSASIVLQPASPIVASLQVCSTRMSIH